MQKQSTYSGNFVYQNGSLAYILTDEGRLVPDSTGFTYEYFIKDHLGNTRVTVKDSLGFAAIQQEAHYYPFGMSINALSYTNPLQKIANKYLYNGKELDTDFGLNWYHYGFRMYDPQLGRFPSLDPKADEFSFVSPYNYAENSPIANIDLWGLQKIFYQLSLRQNMNWWHTYAPTRMTTAGKKFSSTLNAQKKYNVIYHQFNNSERPNGITHRFKNYEDFKEQKYGIWGLHYIDRKGSKISDKTRNNLMKAFGDKTLFALGDIEMKKYFSDGKELIAIGVNSTLLNNLGKSTNKEDKIVNNLESSGTLTHEEDAHAIRYLNNTKSTTEQEHKDYQNWFNTYSPTVNDILTLPKYRNTQAYKNLNELKEIIMKKYE